MTIDDITALMRSGDLRLTVRNTSIQEDGCYGITMSGSPELFTDEFLQAFEECQKILLVRLMCNDVRVCLAPDEHRASYLFQMAFGIGKVFMCPLCAKIREDEKSNLPPVEDCPWVDIPPPARTAV